MISEQELTALATAVSKMESNNNNVNNAEQRKAACLAVLASCAAIITPRLADMMDALAERARAGML